MTPSLYIQCVLMLLLGQALQLFLIKIPAVKERCRVANKVFSWSEWWNSDWNLVVATAVLGAMAIIGLDQIVHWKPEILDYVKWFFAAIGAFGSNLLLSKWSSFEKSLNTIIDKKTNIADGVEPPK